MFVLSKILYLVLVVCSMLFVPLSLEALINLKISAKSAFLIDADSGTVLFEKNSNLRSNPFFMTKLILTYIVFSKIDSKDIKLSDIVVVSQNAINKGGYKSGYPSMLLRKGERVSIDTLLTGLTSLSATDAAIAISEFLYGSEEAALDNINYIIKKLELHNTHLTNIIDTDDKNNYTTALDITILSQILIKRFPQSLSYFKIPSISHNNVKQKNKNELLFATYPRSVMIDGLQSEYNKNSGGSVVFSAVQDKTNFRIIGVILGANSSEHKTYLAQGMLNWAYNNFRRKVIYNKGDLIVKIPVIASKSKDINVYAKEDISYITLRSNGKKKEKVMLSYINLIKGSLNNNLPVANVLVTQNGDYNINYPIFVKEEIVEEHILLQILYSPYYLIKRLFNYEIK